MNYVEKSDAIADEIVSLRRRLHQVPEIGLVLPETLKIVEEKLQALGIPLERHKNSDSVTAVIRGTGTPEAGQKQSVLLRGDMDGLPVTEATGLPFAAQTGSMHACGHDLHTAMLLGAAELLVNDLESLQGDVILMFQAGEEGFDGAKLMIEEGVLNAAGVPLVGAYALHVFSGGFPAGQFAVKSGPIMSASDRLTVTVNGKGGHGSTPHHGVDPIVIAAEMIVALQTMVTRRFDIFDPVVLTVTQFAGGQASSVLPENATFQATVRSFSEASQQQLEVGCQRLLTGIAEAHGATVDLEYERLYPVTVNDERETERVLATARHMFGEDSIEELSNSLTASEDFSRILAEVPGAFIALGATPRSLDPREAPFNHSAEAVFDESCLTRGAALLAELARDRLSEGPQQ
ncbi:M20 family metallopeptidase [Arthrobacter sp. 18067]|uniref:M20 metallopeptidase family protein n=1 Tax=Arthrobacter sp. 18067 TaxID=2681413 RepID=UPI00135BBF2B|nr:M20 family metallopeptidase [Arthrobacter sp. 18067]